MDTFRQNSEHVIRFRRRKLLLLFLPLAVLVAISLIFNGESWRDADAWVYWVFGGLGLFLVFGCVVMPRCLYLRLAPESLIIQYLGSRRTYSWKEVRDFRVVEGPDVSNSPTGNRVVFDLAEGSSHKTMAGKLLATVNRYDRSIMDWFDIAPEELADLLNEYQRHYGGRLDGRPQRKKGAAHNGA